MGLDIYGSFVYGVPGTVESKQREVTRYKVETGEPYKTMQYVNQYLLGGKELSEQQFQDLAGGSQMFFTTDDEFVVGERIKDFGRYFSVCPKDVPKETQEKVRDVLKALDCGCPPALYAVITLSY